MDSPVGTLQITIKLMKELLINVHNIKILSRSDSLNSYIQLLSFLVEKLNQHERINCIFELLDFIINLLSILSISNKEFELFFSDISRGINDSI